MRTDFVLDALEQAPYARQPERDSSLVHHSDRGSQYVSIRYSKRAAMVMSLVQSARLHGHDPWVYLKDVLERLLAHPNNRIEELLPHRWRGPADR